MADKYYAMGIQSAFETPVPHDAVLRVISAAHKYRTAWEEIETIDEDEVVENAQLSAESGGPVTFLVTPDTVLWPFYLMVTSGASAANTPSAGLFTHTVPGPTGVQPATLFTGRQGNAIPGSEEVFPDCTVESIQLQISGTQSMRGTMEVKGNGTGVALSALQDLTGMGDIEAIRPPLTCLSDDGNTVYVVTDFQVTVSRAHDSPNGLCKLGYGAQQVVNEVLRVQGQYSVLFASVAELQSFIDGTETVIEIQGTRESGGDVVVAFTVPKGVKIAGGPELDGRRRPTATFEFRGSLDPASASAFTARAVNDTEEIYPGIDLVP